jgi:hypothetical protein
MGGLMAGRGMAGIDCTTGKTDEWLTPPDLLAALGPFDLDPCAPEVRPWPTAATHYTRADNGLDRPWHGRVWCNPPYGREAARWLRRLADHGTGTAMIFARTETAAFFDTVWNCATALLFIRGRVRFCLPDGRTAADNCGAPSVLVSYGPADAALLAQCGVNGRYVSLSPNSEAAD